MPHPASGYLEAKLMIGLDAGHTKVGTAFQAEALQPWTVGDCSLSQGARIYGRVVSATKRSKSSPESTLALRIETADCDGHKRTPLALHILEVIAPDTSIDSLNNALPRDAQNSGSVVAGTGASALKNNNPASGRENSSIRVGAVTGDDEIRLEIAEGSHFADVLDSNKRNVSLLAGTRLVLGTADMVPGDQQLHLHPSERQP